MLLVLAFVLAGGTVRQGSFVKVEAAAPAAQARLLAVTIPLYPQPGGSMLGLMPVGVNSKPGEYPLELLDRSGKVLESVPYRVVDGRFRVENIAISSAKSQLKAVPEEKDLVGAFFDKTGAERQWTYELTPPTKGCMNSTFGVRRAHNGKLTGDYHAGVDQRGAQGTPVYAVADGHVGLTREFGARGNTIALDHGQGVKTMYFHLSAFEVKEGDAVKRGDLIGRIGSTGRSTGPHLHWSLYANAVPLNPLEWVKLAPCAAAAAKKPAPAPKKARRH